MGQGKYDDLAKRLVELVGGRDNIAFSTHCVTRLRFNIKDKGLVNEQELDGLEGTLGMQWAGEQLQIIIGQQVGDVYSAVCRVAGLQEEEAIDENLDGDLVPKKLDFTPKHILNLFLDTVSGIFVPFIPAVVCCGLLQGLLFCVSSFGLIDAESAEYTFFYTCANTAFFFMPVLIAFSAGKRFKCNPYVAAALGAALVHPTFVGLDGQSVDLFGFIPIHYANYSSTVVPAILTVYFMSWVEKACKKIIPSMVDIIFTPFISFIVSALVGFTVLAPLGGFIGNYVAEGIMAIYNVASPVAIGLYALLYPFLLSTGMQTAFIPIITQNLSMFGYDVIYAGDAASNSAMAAVAIYIFLVAKNKNIKALGSSTGVTALIGVTEPVLYGLILRFRKALIAAVIGGGVGGVVMGFFKVKYLSFGFVPFGTFPLAMTDTFPFYLLGCFVAMAVAVIVLRVLKFDDEEK